MHFIPVIWRLHLHVACALDAHLYWFELSLHTHLDRVEEYIIQGMLCVTLIQFDTAIVVRVHLVLTYCICWR